MSGLSCFEGRRLPYDEACPPWSAALLSPLRLLESCLQGRLHLTCPPSSLPCQGHLRWPLLETRGRLSGCGSGPRGHRAAARCTPSPLSSSPPTALTPHYLLPGVTGRNKDQPGPCRAGSLRAGGIQRKGGMCPRSESSAVRAPEVGRAHPARAAGILGLGVRAGRGGHAGSGGAAATPGQRVPTGLTPPFHSVPFCYFHFGQKTQASTQLLAPAALVTPLLTPGYSPALDPGASGLGPHPAASHPSGPPFPLGAPHSLYLLGLLSQPPSAQSILHPQAAGSFQQAHLTSRSVPGILQRLPVTGWTLWCPLPSIPSTSPPSHHPSCCSLLTCVPSLWLCTK